MFNRHYQFVISTIIIVLSGSAIAWSQEKYLSGVNRQSQKVTVNNTESQPSQKLLKLQTYIPKLGFENILADWLFLQFIQYFGDTEVRKITGYDLIPDYFRSIIQDDPRFLGAYFNLSTANSLYAARPEVTVKLTDQVLKHVYPKFDPKTPLVWSYKGIDQLLFLGDGKGAKHSYGMAAKWALERNDADSREIAGRNLEMAQFLADNPDSRKAQIGAWISILENAQETDTQKRALAEIKKLGGTVSVSPEGRVDIKVPDNLK
jgi:hypothetical protein